MLKKSITKEFENMYGPGKALNFRTNKSIDNMLKNIPNKLDFDNNMGKEFIEPKEPSEPPYWIFAAIAIVIVVGLLYHFRDKIRKFVYRVKPTTTPAPAVTQAAVTQATAIQEAAIQVPTISIQAPAISIQAPVQATPEVSSSVQSPVTTFNTIKTEEERHEEYHKNMKKGGVNKLNESINALSSYKQEQLVKENSYCYIGTDNGQRECTNVFEGDICMSGQIFPKMAVCVNPSLRY